jgi:hypothetical protein
MRAAGAKAVKALRRVGKALSGRYQSKVTKVVMNVGGTTKHMIGRMNRGGLVKRAGEAYARAGHAGIVGGAIATGGGLAYAIRRRKKRKES